MPPRSPADTARVFTSLAEVVRQSHTSQEVYAAICVAATLTVPGCDHASLMICRDGTCRTAAVSDDIARHIDRLELALGMGPCVETIESRSAQLESDLAAGTRWPQLTSRVIAETPVRGAMSIRIPVDGEKIGALNVFSDVPDALGSESLEQAVVLGAFATVASTAAAHSEDASTLRRGLTSNRSIGQAIGILMALNNISDDDAFDILRKTSQTSNVKLVDVAASIIRERGQGETDKTA